MFAPAGKIVLTMTPAAIKQLRALTEGSGGDVYGLRITVKTGGCAGMEYAMEHAAAASPGDEIVEQDGARVLIAPMAVMFMLGTEMDYEEGLFDSGFRFRNPNVVEACGCGESIKFAPAAAE